MSSRTSNKASFLEAEVNKTEAYLEGAFSSLAGALNKFILKKWK